jgi:hypothetical protein
MPGDIATAAEGSNGSVSFPAGADASSRLYERSGLTGRASITTKAWA